MIKKPIWFFEKDKVDTPLGRPMGGGGDKLQYQKGDRSQHYRLCRY